MRAGTIAGFTHTL